MLAIHLLHMSTDQHILVKQARRLNDYSVCFILSDDTMLTHWKKSITGRRVKAVVQGDGNTVADSAAGGNDVETVVCKLCLTPCRMDQMYILEQCRCSFCLEVGDIYYFVL